MLRVLLFLLVFCSCGRSDPEHVKAANRIRAKYNKHIKQNKMQVFGIGGAMFKDIHEFYYDLIVYDSPDINKARQILVENLEMFLRVVNEDENARPYLREYPYSEKYMHFSIGFWIGNFIDAKPPSIASADVYNGKVTYSIYEGKFVDIYKESYAEAYEKVYGVPLCR